MRFDSLPEERNVRWGEYVVLFDVRAQLKVLPLLLACTMLVDLVLGKSLKAFTLNYKGKIFPHS